MNPQQQPPHRTPVTRRQFLAAAGATGAGLALSGALGGCQHETAKPPAPLIGALPERSFARKWNADLQFAADDEAIELHLRDEFVCIYTKRHWAHVLERDTGVLRWSGPVATPGTHLRPPVLLKDFWVFPTTASMEIFDRRGRKIRSYTTELAVRSNAVGYGTKVYFGADAPGGGHVVCLDLAGSQYQHVSIRWELQTRGGLSAGPALHQGLLYCGDEHGNVYAVNADSRAPIWALHEEGREEGVFGAGNGPIRADLKADDYGVYIPSNDYFLYCCDRTSGKIRWKYAAGRPVTHSPYVSATTAYVYVDDLGLVAIEKTDKLTSGKPRWTVPNATQFLAEDDRLAYLRRQDRALIAVDRMTGEVAFTSKRRDFIAASTNAKAAVIYATTERGEVKAIVPNLHSGNVGEQV